MTAHSQPSSSGSIRCGVYAVGYFDLCGQSNALQKYIPINSVIHLREDIQRDFSKIASQLHNFRADITKFFDAAREERLADAAPGEASSETVALAAQLDSAQIRLQGFSDSVVAYVPLAPSPGLASVYPIAAMLISVASTMLMSFARGSVVRGAIDVSWGMETFDGEIYGPALLSAYKLECKVANWPRVVLGDGIKGLWNAYRNHSAETQADKINQFFAALQSSVAFSDTDGHLAVDYLGEQMGVFISQADVDLPGMTDAAHLTIDAMFQEKSGDAKVAGKLQAVLDYFNERKGPLTNERRKRAARFYASGGGA